MLEVISVKILNTQNNLASGIPHCESKIKRAIDFKDHGKKVDDQM